MTDVVRRVVLGYDGAWEQIFEWSGPSASRELAEQSAHDALRSTWHLATGGTDLSLAPWGNRFRTLHSYDSLETDDDYCTILTWKFFAECLSIQTETEENLSSNGSETDLDSVVYNIIANDIGILNLRLESTISVCAFKYSTIFESISVDVLFYNAHDSIKNGSIDLEDDTIFALMTLASVFEFGNIESEARRAVRFEPPPSATLRAARRAQAPSCTQTAAEFFERHGAPEVAERLRSRDRKREQPNG